MSASAARGEGRGTANSFVVLALIVPAGVDAMRVISNAEMDEHHVLDAKMELVVTKCAEMFCESIPGDAPHCRESSYFVHLPPF